jgi:tRNA-dihydrouridine synthase 2
LAGPETIDRALIGCTRRLCPRTNTVTFTRLSSNGLRNPALNPTAKESVIFRLHPALERSKLIFQIGTAKPELAVQAAKLVAADVAGIDVNSGCPKPFSTAGGMGAALLKDPDRLESILRALVKEVGEPWGIGISVKIRLLETQEKTIELVKRLCATGITGLTIHCRTTPMRPREKAIREQLKAIVETCHAAGVACVMNGDVEGREQSIRLMQEFGADGAMIATAAEKDPSVFTTPEVGGKAHWRGIVREYVEIAMSVENRWGNTKFTLAQLIPGKEQHNINIAQCKSHEQTMVALGFDDLIERARELDIQLGINRPELARPIKRAAAREIEQAKKLKLDQEQQQRVHDEEKEGVDSTITNGIAAAIAA